MEGIWRSWFPFVARCNHLKAYFRLLSFLVIDLLDDLANISGRASLIWRYVCAWNLRANGENKGSIALLSEAGVNIAF
jgi:hypothetical protein